MIVTFASLAGIFFALPFLIWVVLKFLEKSRDSTFVWHTRFLIILFVSSVTIASIFLTLAIVYAN